MDTLPEIVLIKIFKYLNMGDLLKLRLTCKLWYELSLISNRKSLCVYTERLPYHIKWTSTNQEISNIDFVKFNCLPKGLDYMMPYQNDTDFNSFFLCLKNSFLRNLKKLCLYSCGRIFDLIKNLNEFSLEELFIYRCSFPIMDTIKSTSLKTLCLYHCICPIGDTYFKMDRLNKLILYLSINYLPILSNPSELKYFECTYFSMRNNFSLEIKNLEILICQRIYDNFDLSNYPKIKQIHLYSNDLGSIYQIKSQISFKKIDVRFTISGYKDLTVLSEFMSYSIDHIVNRNVLIFDKEHLNFLSKNYENLIIQTPWPTFFEYTNLLNCFFGNIPIDFFDKFPRIVKISISNKIDDEFKLIEFLKNCKLIRRLEIRECKLSKKFYDQLSQIKTITHLTIFKDKFSKSKSFSGIDFNFIQNLNNLRWIEIIELDLSNDQLIDLFKHSKNLIFLQTIYFENSLIGELIFNGRYNGHKICEYHLRNRYDEIDIKKNNFNELIDYLKQIKSIK